MKVRGSEYFFLSELNKHKINISVWVFGEAGGLGIFAIRHISENQTQGLQLGLISNNPSIAYVFIAMQHNLITNDAK